MQKAVIHITGRTRHHAHFFIPSLFYFLHSVRNSRCFAKVKRFAYFRIWISCNLNTFLWIHRCMYVNLFFKSWDQLEANLSRVDYDLPPWIHTGNLIDIITTWFFPLIVLMHREKMIKKYPRCRWRLELTKNINIHLLQRVLLKTPKHKYLKIKFKRVRYMYIEWWSFKIQKRIFLDQNNW